MHSLAQSNIVQRICGQDLCLKIPEEKSQIVKSITDQFILKDRQIEIITSIFKNELELGLQMDTEDKTSLQMAITFIPKKLTGKEKGDFLALDLGGTNFRVILLTLDPSSELKSIVKYYEVPDDLRHGHGEQLFEFLADCIFHFLEENELLGRKLPLGFCFSFPMIQTAIDKALLVTWTKTFSCTNVVGQEVVAMLRKALQKYENIDVDVVAIVNDATGTMMMGSYLDKRSAVGLILGTGCNASYFEKIENMKKWENPPLGIKEVLIDIEWGAFGDNKKLDFMKTKYDFIVDSRSLLPRSFTFEKLFAGRYKGELVKQILLELIEKKVLFPDKNLKSDGWTFTAADVSNYLEESCTLDDIQEHLKRKGFTTASIHDAEIVKHVCTVVSVRGSLLVSICLAVLLKRMNKNDATIAVDGSLFKCHPKYKHYMEKFIAALAPNNKFQLILAEDGSGKGAGLVAAVVTSLDKSVLHM